MPRVVVFLLLLATVLSTSFVIDGVKSAPAASGKLTGLPPLQTHIVFRLQNSTHAQLESGCNERGEFILPIVDASVKWSQPMPQGTYLLQTLPAMSCERLPFELASHTHLRRPADPAFASCSVRRPNPSLSALRLLAGGGGLASRPLQRRRQAGHHAVRQWPLRVHRRGRALHGRRLADGSLCADG